MSHVNSNLSPDELERFAYLAGDTRMAAALSDLGDARFMLEPLEDHGIYDVEAFLKEAEGTDAKVSRLEEERDELETERDELKAQLAEAFELLRAAIGLMTLGTKKRAEWVTEASSLLAEA